MISISSIGESLTQIIFAKLGYDIDRYCRLEAVYDDTTLITETGGLLTVVELKGIRGMPGEEETLKIFNSWIQELSAIFKNGDHTLQVVFESDPNSARAEIDAISAPMWATARRLQLEIDDVLTDYFDAVANRCSRERCWVVLETHPTMLAKDVLKKSLKNRIQYMESQEIPYLTQAQNSFRLIPELTTPHLTMVNSFIGEMDSVGVSLEALNLVEALREIRRAIDPEFTDDQWEPSLPGKNRLIKGNRKPDRVPVRHGTGPANEMSHVWYPPLSRQLVVRRIVAESHVDFPSSESVRVGNKWFASLVMEVGPDDPQTFLKLFRRISMDIPWRISYELRPGGLQGLWLSRLVVKIFGWMGETNRKIRDALDDLASYQRFDGTVVGLRISAVTWADDPKELSRRHATLARALQGWGQCQVTDNIGDPVEGVLSTVPAFSAENPAVSMAAPLPDVIHMLPLTRPASPWRTGVVMFRTPDGRLYPMNIASSEQAAWVDLISAPMGSGKSVLLNTINLMSSFAAGAEDVPWLVVIDVGPSSSGVANLMKSALPENLRHKVEYFKLRMDVRSSINPFDTQLGCRKPTAMEREFQVNFFQLLMTDEGETAPYKMAGKMAGVMIDEIYDLFSDKRSPKIYEQHCDSIVDQALESIRFRDYSPNLTWWQVVDILFQAGRIHEATVAQRYAVPLLHDFMGIVKSSIIRDLFAESADNSVQAGNGQMLIDAFSTVISSTIREFPVLSGVTRFDIGDARMVVMDLDEVARDRGRRAAIMYMLARYVGTRNFYLMPEMVDSSPKIYRTYHLKRVQEIKEVKKALVYDEFHRTDGILALRKQVLTDMREGRKWNIRIALSSQILDDFDMEMIDLASSIYILKPANQADIRRLCQLFGLSEVAALRMERDLTAPSAAGANFLTIQNTKKGRYVQVLTNTIGPITRWALTTTAEEMALRNRLYERMDPREARALLGAIYPSGAQEVIEERRRSMDGEDTSLLDQMAEEVLQIAAEMRMKKQRMAR